MSSYEFRSFRYYPVATGVFSERGHPVCIIQKGAVKPAAKTDRKKREAH
jgi:hypothetical protein